MRGLSKLKGELLPSRVWGFLKLCLIRWDTSHSSRYLVEISIYNELRHAWEASHSVLKHNWTKTYLMKYLLVFKLGMDLDILKVVSHRVHASNELRHTKGVSLRD